MSALDGLVETRASVCDDWGEAPGSSNFDACRVRVRFASTDVLTAPR